MELPLLVYPKRFSFSSKNKKSPYSHQKNILMNIGGWARGKGDEALRAPNW